jgi:hypothetical protein
LKVWFFGLGDGSDFLVKSQKGEQKAPRERSLGYKDKGIGYKDKGIGYKDKGIGIPPP